jgi:hypothetical protein
LAALFLTLDLTEYDRMVAMDAVRVAPSVSPAAGAPIMQKAA